MGGAKKGANLWCVVDGRAARLPPTLACPFPILLSCPSFLPSLPSPFPPFLLASLPLPPQVVPLPEPLRDGAAEQFCFLLTPPTADHSAPPTALTAQLIPSDPAARRHFAAAAGKITVYGRHRPPSPGDAEALAGYAVGGGAGDAGDAGSVALRLAWSVALPGRVLAVAARDPSEPMHSAVKVVGGLVRIGIGFRVVTRQRDEGGCICFGVSESNTI